MKGKNFGIAIAIAVIALLVAMAGLFLPRPAAWPDWISFEEPEPGVIKPLGIEKVRRQLWVQGKLTANQTGTDSIVDFLDNGTSIFKIADGGALTHTGSAVLDGNISSNAGAVTVTAPLTVTGPMTVVNTLNVMNAVDFDGTANIDGATTAQSTFDIYGDISSSQAAITVTDDISVTGSVTVVGTLGYKGMYAAKTADYQILATESGTLFSNAGAAASIQVTLPVAEIGLQYGFYISVTKQITIAPQSAAHILHLSNAAGERVGGTTIGDSLWLFCDGNNWIPLHEVGTWSE